MSLRAEVKSFMDRREEWLKEKFDLRNELDKANSKIAMENDNFKWLMNDDGIVTGILDLSNNLFLKFTASVDFEADCFNLQFFPPMPFKKSMTSELTIEISLKLLLDSNHAAANSFKECIEGRMKKILNSLPMKTDR
jgi:hypothetical protein